jgi:hypothetical protein
MSSPIIIFDKVNKWYGNDFHVLRDIDLVVGAGERIVICGPSGSGQVDPHPLHQPPRGAPGRPDRRRRGRESPTT